MKFLVFFLLLFCKSFALNESEFTAIVINNEEYFVKDRIYLDIRKIELDASFKNYANWQNYLGIEVKNSYYKTNKNTDSTSIYVQKSKDNSQKVYLNLYKNFLTNPATLSLGFSKKIPSDDITRYKQDEFYNYYEVDTYDNSYQINYTYPFLRHNSNASKLRVYQKNLLYLQREELDYLDAKEDTLVDKLNDFLKIAELNETNKVYEMYIQELQRIKTNKYDNAVLSEIDLASNKITQNNNQLIELEQNLKIFLKNDELSFQNTYLDYQKDINIVSDAASFIANNNRDLLRYDIDKKVRQIDILYYQNQILPELDFNVSAIKNQNKGNTLTTVYDNDSVEYVSSINFTMPIGGDINDEKNLAIAKLNLERINLDYNASFNDIVADVKSLITALRLDKKLIDNYQKTLTGIQNNINQIMGSENIAELMIAVKQKRDASLDLVEIVAKYQQNMLKYKDILDIIIK